MEQEKPKPKEFDLRTHVRDAKTGDVSNLNHYTYHKSKDGKEYYVRGNRLYHPNGDPMDLEEPKKVAEEPKSEPKPKAKAKEQAEPKVEAKPVSDEKKKPSKSKAQEALEKSEK